MAHAPVNIVVPQEIADTDADVGAGAPAALAGFPVGVLGWDSALDPYFSDFALGTRVYVKGSGRDIVILPGGLSGRVAVVVATLSATAGGAGTGSGVLYLVAPAALGLLGSYALPSAALAAIPAGQDAVILILPGTYNEIATLVVPAATPISFFGLGGKRGSGVRINNTAAGGFFTLNGDTTKFSNLELQASAGCPSVFTCAAASVVLAENCLLSTSAVTDDLFTSPGFVSRLECEDCTLSGAITNSATGSLLRFDRCEVTGQTVGDEVTGTLSSLIGVTTAAVRCARGNLDRCSFTRQTTAGGVIDFVPAPIPNQYLYLTKPTFANTNAPGVATPLVDSGGGNPGIVVLDSPSAIWNTDPLYQWVTSVHSVLGNSFSSQRLVNTYLPAAPATIGSLCDIALVDPAAAVTMSAPVAALDIPGRRLLVRNISATIGFYLAPSGAEVIDNQTATEPLWVPPLGVLEIECQRIPAGSAFWRRVQPRNAGDVYVVAKAESAIPNSYPDFASVKALIDKDKAARTFIPTILVYPGTYLGNVAFNYSVGIRGADPDPYAATIDGQLSLTAGAANDSFSVENIRVLKGTGWSDAAFAATLEVRNCVFAIDVAASTLTVATANANTVARVTNCQMYPDATNGVAGVVLTGTGRYYFARNIAYGTNRTSFRLTTAGAGTLIEENYFEGSARFLQTSPGVTVTVRRNRYGTENSTGPGFCIAAGFDIYLEDELCVPLGITDRGLDTAAIGTPLVGRLRLLAAGVPINPAGQTTPLRQYPSRWREDAAGFALQVGPTVFRVAGGAGAYVLPSYSNFTVCCDVYVFNDQAVGITVAPAGGENFGPAGAANPQVVPAGGRLHLLADPANGVWWIVSTV